MPIAVSVIFPLDVAALNAKFHLLAVGTVRAGNIGEVNQRPPCVIALANIAPKDAAAVIFQFYLTAIFAVLAFQVGKGHQVLPIGICAGGVSPLNIAIGYLQFHFSAVCTVCAIAASDCIQRHKVTPCGVWLVCVFPLNLTGFLIGAKFHLAAILPARIAHQLNVAQITDGSHAVFHGDFHIHCSAGKVGASIVFLLRIEPQSVVPIRNAGQGDVDRAAGGGGIAQFDQLVVIENVRAVVRGQHAGKVLIFAGVGSIAKGECFAGLGRLCGIGGHGQFQAIVKNGIFIYLKIVKAFSQNQRIGVAANRYPFDIFCKVERIGNVQIERRAHTIILVLGITHHFSVCSLHSIYERKTPSVVCRTQPVTPDRRHIVIEFTLEDFSVGSVRFVFGQRPERLIMRRLAVDAVRRSEGAGNDEGTFLAGQIQILAAENRHLFLQKTFQIA